MEWCYSSTVDPHLPEPCGTKGSSDMPKVRLNVAICDRLWENGAFGAENENVVFNLF